MRKNCFSKKNKKIQPPPPPEFFFLTPNYNFFNVGNSIKREENILKYFLKNS